MGPCVRRDDPLKCHAKQTSAFSRRHASEVWPNFCPPDDRGRRECRAPDAPDKEACSPMSSFFGDVQPELQIAFAQMHGITKAQLIAAAKTFAAHSGQSYPLAA